MQQDMYVSGYGVISTAGRGLPALASSLSSSQNPTCIEALPFNGQTYPFARLPRSLGAEAALTTLATMCMEEVLETSGLGMEQITAASTALLLGTTAGVQKRWTGDDGPGDYGHRVSVKEFIECEALEALVEHFGFKGPSFAVNTACASSLSALTMACRLIASGRVQRALVGAVEFLSWFDVAGFSCSGLLSKKDCRPFDRNRDGLMLGEAAIFTLVEKSEDVRNPYFRILSFDSLNDLYDIASPDPAGVKLKQCIDNTLFKAGLQPDEIDYVNAHGTGTRQNDHSESLVYASTWPAQHCSTAISSTKGIHGHLRAAGGLLELLACGIAINESVIPYNRGCIHPVDPGSWRCALLEHQAGKVNRALSVSRGFGGSNVSIAISTI